MKAREVFTFADVEKLPPREDALVGFVPTATTTVHELLMGVADTLRFPQYFGANWNALFDLLRDFHWTDRRQIVLIHRDLPGIPRSELKIYLEVLRDAAIDWKPGEAHHLQIIFDTALEKSVLNVLSNT